MATGTFGYFDFGGGSYDPLATRIYASKATMPTTGTITSIVSYLQGPDSGSTGNIQLGFYNDSSGTPNALQANSATKSFPVAQAAAWTTFAMNKPVVVSPADYWLSIFSDANNTVGYLSSTTGTSWEKEDSNPSPFSWPATWTNTGTNNTPFAIYANYTSAQLVGSVGAVTTGSAVNTAITPAWGAGSSQTVGNLLVLVVAGNEVNTKPSTPSGWSAAQQTNSSGPCSASIFYKIAAGGDAAPTVAAVASTIWSGQLMEFSGIDQNTILDQTGFANSSTGSSITCSNTSADVTGGELVISAGAVHYSAAATKTLTDAWNNDTAFTSTTNNSTSTKDHYSFSYGFNTGNTSADTDTFSYTSTNRNGVAIVTASFKLAQPVQPVFYLPAPTWRRPGRRLFRTVLLPSTYGVQATTYVDSQSGSITLSGTVSAEQKKFTDSNSGTITLTGSGQASEHETYTDSRTGTITLSGSATDNNFILYIDSPTGTITLSAGSVTESWKSVSTGSGTITLSGTTVESEKFTDSKSGTITLGGSAVENWGVIYTDSQSGTITLGGSKTESLKYTDSPQGTISLNGSGSLVSSFVDSMSGGITITGFDIEHIFNILLPDFLYHWHTGLGRLENIEQWLHDNTSFVYADRHTEYTMLSRINNIEQYLKDNPVGDPFLPGGSLTGTSRLWAIEQYLLKATDSTG